MAEIDLGQNLRQILKSQNLKAIYIAAKCDITSQRVSRLLRQSNISDEVLKKIGDAIGVSVDFIKNWHSASDDLIYNDTDDLGITLSDKLICRVLETFDELVSTFKVEICDLKAEITSLKEEEKP